MIQKPFTVAREEFTLSITKTITESGLPPSVMADIFDDILVELKKASRIQLEKDKAAYEEAIKKEQDSKKEKQDKK